MLSPRLVARLGQGRVFSARSRTVEVRCSERRPVSWALLLFVVDAERSLLGC